MNTINSREYYHESDKKALEALKDIPGFTQALKAFMKIFNENVFHGINMASKLRLGPDQMPEIYNLLPPICEVLGIEEPELYLELNPNPNAYTYGDTKCFITITSGLIESLELEEVKTVIAHECGHIACHHVLYHTMASLLLSGGSQIFDLGVVTLPLQIAFFYWRRCSELSADRAAAIYMDGSDKVVDIMMRFAGASKEITTSINKELYLQQAREYVNILDNSTFDKTLQYLALLQNTHPYSAVRAYEITEWCKGDKFNKIMSYKNQTKSNICPNCQNEINDAWKFCKKCGSKIN